MKLSSFPSRRSRGFTLMEILVVVAIILVLAALIFPVMSTISQKRSKVVALSNMKQLASAAQTYMGQNDGALPAEDSKGTDSWQSAVDPANNKAWYNSLPRLLGKRTVGEYASTPKEFYTRDNLLFLPGAGYPESDKKLVRPMFAIAINTKLQRKDSEGNKGAKLAQITNPSQTVLFLEQGLPGEHQEFKQQPKYDGSPKGSAKSFIGRYGGFGHLAFIDGHVDTYMPKDLLKEDGTFPFPQEVAVWTRTPDEDPNKK